MVQLCLFSKVYLLVALLFCVGFSHIISGEWNVATPGNCIRKPLNVYMSLPLFIVLLG